MVIDKQAGLVVHPAPGHPSGTLVNALLHHVGDLSGIGGTLRPGIVHRLDRDTSGLMVAAKTDRAHRGLSDALRERRVKRIYLAALWGSLAEDAVVVDRPVGRHPRDRTRMGVVVGAGRRERVCGTWRGGRPRRSARPRWTRDARTRSGCTRRRSGMRWWGTRSTEREGSGDSRGMRAGGRRSWPREHRGSSCMRTVWSSNIPCRGR